VRLKRPDGLNVVPFIDVMLVLLAIVLTVSTFIAKDNIKVDIPSSSVAEQSGDKKLFELKIDSDNKIYIKEEEVDIATLRDEIFKIDGKDEIVIFGDVKSDFGRFVEIVNILKEKGHKNFQIAIKYEKKQSI
jgi:biopolymer transport protein ExbD